MFSLPVVDRSLGRHAWKLADADERNAHCGQLADLGAQFLCVARRSAGTGMLRLLRCRAVGVGGAGLLVGGWLAVTALALAVAVGGVRRGVDDGHAAGLVVRSAARRWRIRSRM
jgi:hypothetical protein